MALKFKDARLGTKARRSRRSDRFREEDSRLLDDQERLTEFRKSLYQSILPNLPKIKGYHVIWLTTNNPADSIQARMRLGYEPIKPDEVPGFESLAIKNAQLGMNLISVNEMVAFKLPLGLYQMYMREAHHDQPLLEEQKLTDAIDAVTEQARHMAKRGKKAVRVEYEEGTEAIVEDRPVPKFRKLHGER
jgi:hypothetical protein